MSKQDDKLIAFLVNQMGGEEEAIWEKFYLERVKQLTTEEYTISGIRDIARREDWLHIFDGFTCLEIAEAFADQPDPFSDGLSRRLTAVQVREIRSRIVECLKQTSWVTKTDIAEAVGFPKQKLGPQLRVLCQQKKIKKTGLKAGTRYALTGAR